MKVRVCVHILRSPPLKVGALKVGALKVGALPHQLIHLRLRVPYAAQHRRIGQPRANIRLERLEIALVLSAVDEDGTRLRRAASCRVGEVPRCAPATATR